MKRIILLYLIYPYAFILPQWETQERIGTQYVYSAMFSGNNIYAGSNDSIYISTDGGTTWGANMFLQDSNMVVSEIAEHNSIIYAGSYGEGVYKSSDNGKTWIHFSEGLTGAALYISKILVSGDTMLLGTDGGGVYIRDLNSDKAWNAFNNNLPDKVAWTINDLCETNSTYIASAGASGYYFICRKGSSEWNERRIDTTGRLSLTPAVLFSDNDIVFAGTRFGIYRSIDQGYTWDSVGVSALPLQVAAFAKADNRIYAAFTRSGDFFVWYSDDNGNSWNSMDHQFAFLKQLLFYDSRLWAATNIGLLKSQVLTSIPENEITPGNFILHQNYPNPFNPRTTIKYNIASAGRVTVKVYDVLGNLVSILVDEEKQAGEHAILFNGAGIASGVYFYSLVRSSKDGIQQRTMKMLVVK